MTARKVAPAGAQLVYRRPSPFGDEHDNLVERGWSESMITQFLPDPLRTNLAKACCKTPLFG